MSFVMKQRPTAIARALPNDKSHRDMGFEEDGAFRKLS